MRELPEQLRSQGRKPYAIPVGGSNGIGATGYVVAMIELMGQLRAKGQRVDHFVFGLCDVMVVREERMKIRDAAGGKLREIHLRAVKVLKPTVEDGRRVFKLARRK